MDCPRCSRPIEGFSSGRGGAPFLPLFLSPSSLSLISLVLRLRRPAFLPIYTLLNIVGYTRSENAVRCPHIKGTFLEKGIWFPMNPTGPEPNFPPLSISDRQVLISNSVFDVRIAELMAILCQNPSNLRSEQAKNSLLAKPGGPLRLVGELCVERPWPFRGEGGSPR